MNIAERIKRRRKALKWTQARLANEAGLSGGKTHVSKLENGKNVPLPETISALARAMGVTPGYFFKPVANSSAKDNSKKDVA